MVKRNGRPFTLNAITCEELDVVDGSAGTDEPDDAVDDVMLLADGVASVSVD